jgi:hypothetical protein
MEVTTWLKPSGNSCHEIWRFKYKLRQRKGGSYPLSHLYGHFGLVRLSARGREQAWAKA